MGYSKILLSHFYKCPVHLPLQTVPSKAVYFQDSNLFCIKLYPAKDRNVWKSGEIEIGIYIPSKSGGFTFKAVLNKWILHVEKKKKE